MTADVLLSCGGKRWVLDAKYKRDFGCEDRNDRFQATAYALAFDAGRGTLVYPTADGTYARCRLLLAGTVSKNRVMIDSIELPMAAGPEVCRRAFIDVMRQGEPAPHRQRTSPPPTLFDHL
jgi:5-methylcytosine-specific restriction endonuclease McrBC regulatory subunit McrC